MKGDIHLKQGRERSVHNRHPWIFSGAINRITGDPAEGDLVRVLSGNEEVLGFGHYGEKNISVRMLGFKGESFGLEFWRQRIEEAIELRRKLKLGLSSDTNAYRIFNAEGDGIPGLVIDRYGDFVVLEIHSQGVANARLEIERALTALGFKNIVVRAGAGLKLADLPSEAPAIEANFLENGLHFSADLTYGQKTGFFLDQRENRALVRSYAAGRKVLNAFAYTGGFSVSALKAGAKELHSVEISEEAIKRLERHLEMNGCRTDHQSIKADCFKFLESSKEQYDLIILDPPAFAKHRSAKVAAVRAYESLNHLGLKRLAPGGVCFSFSCSLFVTREEFREAVYHAATKLRRPIRILGELGAGPDHPVSLYHREGEYLKGLLLQIN